MATKSELLRQQMTQQGVTVTRVAPPVVNGWNRADTARPAAAVTQTQRTASLPNLGTPAALDSQQVDIPASQFEQTDVQAQDGDSDLVNGLDFIPRGGPGSLQGPRTVPTIAISGHDGRIALNSALGHAMGGFENFHAARLHFNARLNTMVIEPTAVDTPGAYRVTSTREKQGQLSCSNFLRVIGFKVGEKQPPRRYYARLGDENGPLADCLIVALTPENEVVPGNTRGQR